MEGKKEYKKGLWTEEEDTILMEHIRVHGKGRWNRVAKMTGLKRGGKSCRLRWINYLSPSVKRGDFSEEENDLIIRLHNLLGNRWSLIAGRVPGRTDNQVKNHWNTHLTKKLGVRREKRRIFGSTSPPPLNPLPLLSSPSSSSSEVVEKSVVNVEEKKAISSNISPFNNQKSIENNGEEEGFLSSKEEMGAMNEDYDVDSSFWLINNDYNINQDQQLHFMEFLDDSSPLDFLWSGL